MTAGQMCTLLSRLPDQDKDVLVAVETDAGLVPARTMKIVTVGGKYPPAVPGRGGLKRGTKVLLISEWVTRPIYAPEDYQG